MVRECGNTKKGFIQMSKRIARDILILPTATNSWVLMRDGNKKPSQTFPTQNEAIATGREMARNDKRQLVIYNRKGIMRLIFNYNTDFQCL